MIYTNTANYQPALWQQANTCQAKHQGWTPNQPTWQQQNPATQQSLGSMLNQLVGLLRGQQGYQQPYNGLSPQAQDANTLHALFQQRDQQIRANSSQSQNMDGLLQQQQAQMQSTVAYQQKQQQLNNLFQGYQGAPNWNQNEVRNHAQNGMQGLMHLQLEDIKRSAQFQQQSPQVQGQLLTAAERIIHQTPAEMGIQIGSPTMDIDFTSRHTPPNYPLPMSIQPAPPMPQLTPQMMLQQQNQMESRMQMQAEQAQINMREQMVSSYYANHGVDNRTLDGQLTIAVNHLIELLNGYAPNQTGYYA